MSDIALSTSPPQEWLTLYDRSTAAESPLEVASGFGEPGLWRVVRDPAAAGPLVRVFEAPRPEGAPAADPVEAPDPAALLAWAESTRTPGAGVPCGRWTPPERAEVETWIAPHRLRVRSVGRVVRGKLVLEPNRLALVFPDLANVPADTAPARLAWLERLLLDAQSSWRLVRFGIDGQTRALGAEVDLTGVPESSARALVQLALESLAWAVEWVLSPLSFLVDAGAQSRALADLPSTT